ncbi:metallophosphoesterase [Pseudoruegeria sp. HB172150]|uniref:metallophosphoesterase family protein n=1 Tax=Pseudoruegeria sp. HB172150 TaxID=2721164 RepID=UPI0015535A8D|nr:metallophosphoesterase family protein [Pseudoruegeria sp. HB172150]
MDITPDRLAVIADIHGNADALTAVLADIDALGNAEIVNLGDHLSSPLAAAETAEILLSRPMTCIRGNHDRYLIEHLPAEMHRTDATAYRQLQPRHIDWLETLPPVAEMGEVLLCHATPQDDETYFLEEVRPDGALIRRPHKGIAELAGSSAHKVILCAHTHLPRAVRLTDGRLIVNPGSVGVPGYTDDTPYPHAVEAGTPDANYAILERKGDSWRVNFRLVPYDPSRMSEMARREGRDDWAAMLETGWIKT